MVRIGYIRCVGEKNLSLVFYLQERKIFAFGCFYQVLLLF